MIAYKIVMDYGLPEFFSYGIKRELKEGRQNPLYLSYAIGKKAAGYDNTFLFVYKNPIRAIKRMIEAYAAGVDDLALIECVCSDDLKKLNEDIPAVTLKMSEADVASVMLWHKNRKKMLSMSPRPGTWTCSWVKPKQVIISTHQENPDGSVPRKSWRACFGIKENHKLKRKDLYSEEPPDVHDYVEIYL